MTLPPRHMNTKESSFIVEGRGANGTRAHHHASAGLYSLGGQHSLSMQSRLGEAVFHPNGTKRWTLPCA